MRIILLLALIGSILSSSFHIVAANEKQSAFRLVSITSPDGNLTSSTRNKIKVNDGEGVLPNNNVNFGDVAKDTLLEKTIVLINDEDSSLTIGSLAAVDVLEAPFSLSADNCSDKTLAKDETCDFTVGFTPSSTDDVSDTFDVPTDDANNPSVMVTVFGRGTTQALMTITDSVSPTDDLEIDFGAVEINSSLDQTITITNDGNADLNLQSLVPGASNENSSSFIVANDSCIESAIIPGESCTVTLQFSPEKEGEVSFSIDIPSSNSNVETVSISLLGSGIPVINNTAPSKPQLISPNDNETDVTIDVDLRWQISSDLDGDELTYQVYYCDNEDFSGCTANAVAKGLLPTFDVSLLHLNFLVVGLLSGIGLFRNKRFLFYAFIALATLNISACQPTTDDPTVSSLIFEVSNLTPNTTYYWKVSVGDGKSTTESDVWQFTTRQ